MVKQERLRKKRPRKQRYHSGAIVIIMHGIQADKESKDKV